MTTQPGQDFLVMPGTLTIPAGQLSGTISFTTLEDTIDEPNEAFTLTLSNPAGALVSQATGIVTISDDDGVQLPLFELSDMAYLGAFRVPTGQQGASLFDFGGNSVTFNPVNNSLFLASDTNSGLNIAEIAIPASLSNGTNLSQMSVATVLQPFVNLSGLLTVNAAGSNTVPALGYENLNLGGLLVADGGLTGGMFMGYNGAEPLNSTHSHFRTTGLNLSALSTTTFAGLLDVRKNVNSAGGRIRGGYMAEVPERWRAWIGANYVTGAAAQNRIQFSSSGPALFGFDAVNPTASSGSALVSYPYGHELQWASPPSGPLPIFNGTTNIEGVAFVPGTRSVIFLGSNGLSSIGYGLGSLFNDTARPYSGFHSQNGNYKYQIWAYDIDDFVSVRNGTKASWEIQPTSVLNFDLPTPEPSKHLGGVTFDPATSRLYVSQKFAGPNSTPVIHVYQLGRTGSGSPAPSLSSIPPYTNQPRTSPVQESFPESDIQQNLNGLTKSAENLSAIFSTSDSDVVVAKARLANPTSATSTTAAQTVHTLTDDLFGSLSLELNILN